MGFGRKKTDAAQILGRLSVMPWDNEPLTEIQPHNVGTALSSEIINNQETAVSAVDPETK
jgi:hypothetical protein